MKRIVIMLLMVSLLTACEQDCIPTTTTAADASIVVAPDAVRSGVLRATLTAAEGSLPDKQMTFQVSQTVAGSNTLGTAMTDQEGVATLDLKERPLRLTKTVNNDVYTAFFAGDATHCSSSSSAALDIVRAEL